MKEVFKAHSSRPGTKNNGSDNGVFMSYFEDDQFHEFLVSNIDRILIIFLVES